jgi:type I restriction enzyme S subunit
MKLETFFENFDLLTDAPNAATKLRELVLQLAVRGKLVEHNPEDEPALVAVQRMVKLRENLVLAKKAKPYKNFEPITDEEIAFHLPKNWEIVRLGRITDLVSGVTKGRKLANRETANFPYLRVANVQRGYLDLKIIKEIEIPVEELDKYELKSGDVLLTEGGDWDKLGRAAIWEDEIPKCIHQNHVFSGEIIGFRSHS